MKKYVKILYSLKISYHKISSSIYGFNFLKLISFYMLFPQGGTSYQYLLRDIYEDLIQRLLVISSDDNIFNSQPCRDNTLYLLKLVDEMLISELDNKLPVLNLT